MRRLGIVPTRSIDSTRIQATKELHENAHARCDGGLKLQGPSREGGLNGGWVLGGVVSVCV